MLTLGNSEVKMMIREKEKQSLREIRKSKVDIDL